MSDTTGGKVTISSGPFHVALENVDTDDITRLVITIKNPTQKRLEARVSLGICNNSTDLEEELDSLGEFATGKSNENEFHFGCIKVNPCSCVRIERFIDDTELRSTFCILATGDFAVEV